MISVQPSQFQVSEPQISYMWSATVLEGGLLACENLDHGLRSLQSSL